MNNLGYILREYLSNHFYDSILNVINDQNTSNKNIKFDSSEAVFTKKNVDYLITSLVLDGEEIDFTKLKDLDALKSLTIQNNSIIDHTFNTDKVLPHGLEELVITDCQKFSMVNLDNQKASLKTLKILKDVNNVSDFETF